MLESVLSRTLASIAPAVGPPGAAIDSAHAAVSSGMPILPITIFLGILLTLVVLDLTVLNRRSHVIRSGEALLWTGFWMTVALAFGGCVYLAYENHWFGLGTGGPHVTSGATALIQYITGYLVEQSLSLDNIFVIATIFSYFRVPPQHQHRVLFWGILGVVILRGAMIAGGAALIHRFDWTVYVFGGLLFFSAIKMLALNTDNINIEANWVVRAARKLIPIHSEYDGERFFTRVDGKRFATPLLLVLLMVESADAVFAVDSIPAIFSFTTDPFIVLTSNVFAILGLRSLYFALSAIMHTFKYLKVSLAFLLAFIGVKMVISHHYPIHPFVSLAVIAGILGTGIIASLVSDRRNGLSRDGVLGPDVARVTRLTIRQAKKLIILVFGVTIVAVGIAMIVLPGPGLLFVIVGFALLATEFVWARRLLKKYQGQAADFAERADRALHMQGRFSGLLARIGLKRARSGPADEESAQPPTAAGSPPDERRAG